MLTVTIFDVIESLTSTRINYEHKLHNNKYTKAKFILILLEEIKHCKYFFLDQLKD